MRHFSVVLALSLGDRLFSERKIRSRSACRVIACALVCLLLLFGSAAYGQSPVGDAFNESTLNTSLWTVKAPVSGSAALSGGQLVITVPGGSNHQAYTPLNAVRVIQAVSNANFDVYVKINSQLTSSAQDSFAGLLVGGDGSNWIYYYAYTDGSNVDLLCASVDSGVQNIRLNTIPFAGYPVPTYLRLQRAGTTYTAYWSADAVSWTSAGSFNDSLVVTHLGPFAGNNNSTPANAPAVSAAFGGFQNTPAESATATPTFTPPSGTSFTSTLSVTIADTTPGATIYYTTDGSTPTTSSTVYSGAITLTASTTVKAIATASGDTQSAVGSASYTLATESPAATPTFTPPSGTTFSSTLSVTIADSTPNATIYYTTDGSTPTTSSAVYSGAITLSASATVKAIATASGFTQSAVGSASYALVTESPAATPTFTPATGTSFSSTLSVTIADSTPSSTIYFTTDGSTPTTSSAIYSGAITLSASATVKAIATASGFTQSAVGSASYTLVTESPAATPTFTPGSGTSFSTPLSVTMSDATPSSTIYYTTDGSTPTTSSAVYSGAITLNTSTTVKAIATASGFAQSAIGTASYTYAPVAGTPVADEFNESSLNTSLWTIRTPAGGTAALSNGELVLTVPGGSNHQAYTPLNAVRVVQPVSNANFDVALKIDSQLVASANQVFQGLLVGGDGSDYIYYYAYTDGSNIDLLCASVDSGVQNIRLNTIPFAGYVVPTYLRMQRVGTTYTAYWSADGVNWNTAGSFSDNLHVTALGPIAGNDNNTPANAPPLSASFDWFHDVSTGSQSAAATPTFTPASGTSFSSTLSVTIADSTPNATIYYTTDGTTPTTSSPVYSGAITLTASTTVKAIATASGFIQSAVGSASYTLVTESPAATPTFTPSSGTSFSSTLSVTIADSTPNATIYYTTDGSTPTTSSAIYSGAITLTASTTVKAIATANGFTQSAVGSASYTLMVAAGAPVSDEFNESSLNTGLWTVRAPVGGTAAVSNGELVIAVPAGSNHDAFVPALDAVQVVQSISNANFDVAVKVDSTLLASATYSGLGIMVEGDAKDYIRYELGATGSIVLSASTITSGNQTTQISLAPFSGYAVPTYLRLQRVGTTYTAFWSADGVNWNQAGSFTDSLTVTGLAPYAWNYNATPSNAPAITAKFDWFHNITTTPTAATPTFSPASGTSFSSTLSVSIADSTPNATIYYTTDGSTPTTGSTVFSSSSPIELSASATIKAIATASGFNQSAVGSASYTFTGGGTGGIVSDNFDEPALNSSLWTTENPLGDGIVTMIGTAATLNVPQGTIHNLSTSADNSLRIMQPAGNSNFSVDVRFQSAPEIGNQDEGILVEQDSGDFLRFDVFFNGTVGPELFAAGVTGSSTTTFISTQISVPKAPLVLRLARNGNVWTGSWSTDGVTFTAAPNFTFDLNAARVGPYAGTFASTAANSPAFTAIVDYFFATSDPIANQDGALPYGYTTIDANPPTVVEKTLADIEGTGRLNPVIGTEEPTINGNMGTGGIYWYQYPASGNITGTWTKHTIVSSGNAYEDMVPLDVNGDGAVDIICSYDPTDTGNYQIVWFENPRGQGGSATTSPWAEHVIGPGFGENNMFLADIDGDGKMDVVTPSSIFFQNSATSWTQVTYSTSFRGVGLLDIGSGLGSINLSGTGPSPFNLVWYENPRETGGNARTGKWIMHTIASTPYPCTPASTCGDGGDAAVYNGLDVNGDGMMDIISAQSEGNQTGPVPPGGLIWWQAPADRRNGTWIKHTIDANMIDVHRIAIGDMDKNGTTDIIVAEQDQAPLRRVTVYYNDGNGVLTPETISNAEGHNIWVGDITGTGTLEIFNSGHGYFLNAHPLQIFLNPY